MDEKPLPDGRLDLVPCAPANELRRDEVAAESFRLPSRPMALPRDSSARQLSQYRFSIISPCSACVPQNAPPQPPQKRRGSFVSTHSHHCRKAVESLKSKLTKQTKVLAAPLVHARVRHRVGHVSGVAFRQRPLVQHMLGPLDRLKASIQRLTALSALSMGSRIGR